MQVYIRRVLSLYENGGIVMGVSRRAYQELIDGDIEWLLRQPRDLERDQRGTSYAF